MQLKIESYKKAMGKFPTGVSIITLTVDNQHIAITINSLASVSLLPTRILFCIHNDSSVLHLFSKGTKFVVNILSYTQKNIALTFATPSKQNWKNIEFTPSEKYGLPVFVETLSYIECELYDICDGGDHKIIVSNALNTKILSESNPLIYYEKKFITIGDNNND